MTIKPTPATKPISQALQAVHAPGHTPIGPVGDAGDTDVRQTVAARPPLAPPSLPAPPKGLPAADARANADALIDAALCGSSQKIYALYHAGNVNAPLEATGLRALHLAANAGHLDVLNALLHLGANPSICDDPSTSKDTSLHYAIVGGQPQAARLLLEHGADPRALNCVNTEPAHDAAKFNQPALMADLIRHGADPAAPNTYGNSPFHRACMFGHQAVAAVCLESLAPAQRAELINRPNHSKFTPLDLATGRGHRALSLWLQGLGATHGQRFANLTPTAQATMDFSEVGAWQAYLQTLNGPNQT